MVETISGDRQKAYRRKPVFAVWIGGDEASTRAFESVGVPHFATEADAMRGLMHLVRYREAQEHLMETPESLPRDFAPDAATRARSSPARSRGPRLARPDEATGFLPPTASRRRR